MRTIEGYHNDPYARLDPYFLHHVYGPQQMRQALAGYSLERLQGAARAVQAREPGTRPRSMARKSDVTAYIVEHVNANPHEAETAQQYPPGGSAQVRALYH